MIDAKKNSCGWRALIALFAVGAGLAGCADAFLPKVKARSARILKNAIQVEFENLTGEFDKLDRKGDLALCAPMRFGVARFAVYQAVEERRTAGMAQMTRFLTRARAAIGQAQEKMRKGRCVDSDGDGLTDIAEYRRYRTKADSADTDGDGLSDGLEIRRYRTNPLKADTDADLLDDGAEISRGFSPILADSDGDGFIDGIEVAHGANPRDACSQPLDAQRLDRRRECRPKRVQGERSRTRRRKKRLPEPAIEAAPVPDEKGRRKARKPKTRPPSPKASGERARSLGKAKWNRKERKPTPERHPSRPGQKIQAARTRRANETASSHEKPRKAAGRNGNTPAVERNAAERKAASQPTTRNAKPAKRRLPEKPPTPAPRRSIAASSPGLTSPEKPQAPAPVVVSLARRPPEADKPDPALPKNGTPGPANVKPAKKASFGDDAPGFPSMIFLRLW